MEALMIKNILSSSLDIQSNLQWENIFFIWVCLQHLEFGTFLQHLVHAWPNKFWKHLFQSVSILLELNFQYMIWQNSVLVNSFRSLYRSCSSSPSAWTWPCQEEAKLCLKTSSCHQCYLNMQSLSSLTGITSPWHRQNIFVPLPWSRAETLSFVVKKYPFLAQNVFFVKAGGA